MNQEEFRKFAVKDQGISGSTFDDYASTVQNMTQYVIEERPGNFRAIDVFTRLISDRIIFLGMGVDSQIANIITAQLLFLESSDPKKDIIMYINSPGGSVYDGLGIYDTMQYVNPEVATICTGMAASMAAVLMSAGTKGKRAALPHSRIMIHQPSGGMQGQSRDMEITLKQMQETFLKGRKLDISDPTVALEVGETNMILVDRHDLWTTGIQEISLLDDVFVTLEVQFYGEVGKSSF